MSRQHRCGKRSLVYSHRCSLRVEQLEDRRLLSGVPGDFNENGIVDAADYVVWRDNLGSDTVLNNDGDLGAPVGQVHYALWKANHGQLAPYWHQLGDDLLISEFMADNDGGLLDSDGDSPDWIELWNPTSSPISLAGHYLTDNRQVPNKWALPAITLQPNRFLVVFASGKDRIGPDGELHTDFPAQQVCRFTPCPQP